MVVRSQREEEIGRRKWEVIFQQNKVSVFKIDSRNLLYNIISIVNNTVLVTQSCSTLCNTMSCSLQFLCPWGSLGKNTGVGSHSLLWGNLYALGLNPGLQHSWQILYHLSYKGRFILYCALKHLLRVNLKCSYHTHTHTHTHTHIGKTK